MSPRASDPIDAASRINDAEGAKDLLRRSLSPAVVRALALRADGLRFHEPWSAMAVATTALEALGRISPPIHQSATAGIVWAVYGSACRTVARFKEADLAFAVAVGAIPRSRTQMRADLAKRVAYLRADQGHSAKVEPLVMVFLDHARHIGDREFGRQLVDAGAISFLVENYKASLGYLQQAIQLLPKNGDSYHLSAVHNLACCHFELASSRHGLLHALTLSRQAAALIEAGSYSELKLLWLVGKIEHRLKRLDESLESLESARQGIDQRGDGYDRALLVLDIAELHLDRRDLESARALARSSFAILAVLRKDKEAYKALRVFYRAGASLALDRSIVSTCRQRLLELQRVPRRPER